MSRNWSRRDFAQLSGAAAIGTQLGAGAGAPIESPYSPQDGEWKIAWPGRLAQHDLVFLSPPEDPSLGLPLGNGDLGALLWTSENGLVLAINKCDTWDDNEPRPFRNWGPAEEERHTTLRHCGRLVVDFGCPALDLLYQQDFEARLELAAAVASLRAVTPFVALKASAYVSAPHQVLVLRCESEAPDSYTPRIQLERWGSRTFAHWYSQVNRDPRHGLSGTGTMIERDRMVIRQQLRTLSFVVMAQVVPEGATVRPRKLHGRAAAVELPPAGKSGFTVLVTAVTSENDPDPTAAAHRILDRAVAAGEPAIREAHEADWRKFWSASMISLPEKYLESIWHLVLYFANSSSRGTYPPHFCNGIWGWNRDFVPWNYYFQWNMQWYNWPLATANHAELGAPYYRLRRTQLPYAVRYATERLNKPGAFYADVSERRGYNDSEPDLNQTPGAQIALDFWRQYTFTGDEAFLRESAWPVIRETARFNSATLKKGEDGLYHTSGTRAYEGSPVFDDSITDLSLTRALFPVAIEAGRRMRHDEAEIARWEEQRAHLPPFRLAELEEFEYERKGDTQVHRAGLSAGKPLASRKVFLVGREMKTGKWLRDRYGGRPDLAYYGIPDPEMAPVFPAGIVGLSQRDSELFRASVTQVRLHPASIPDPNPCEPANMSTAGNICMGWCPYPIVLARLGLADELAAELANSISTWQFYPQGFGHYGPYKVFQRDRDQRWFSNTVRDPATVAKGRQPDKYPFPAWPFRHFDNEAMPIVTCAINEMLLQSHEGAIRVCAAVPADWHVGFELAAAGGFLVSAEYRDRRLAWVSVESGRGGECRLVHPWPAEGAVTCLEMPEGRKEALSETTAGADRVLAWATSPGRRYLIVREEAALRNWKTVPAAPERNRAPRRLKAAILGRERLF